MLLVRRLALLWLPAALANPPKSTLQVTSPSSMAANVTHQSALFGPYPSTRIEGRIWYPLDPTGNGVDACADWNLEQMQWKDPAYAGTSPILLLNRGTCTFVTKVRRAQKSGAAAVIIADNDPVEPFVPLMADDGSGADITIPSMIVSYDEGVTLRGYVTQLMNEAINNTNCVAWRQTAGCYPSGARETQNDRDCEVDIPTGISGYCECEDGTRAMLRGCGAGSDGTCLVCQGEGIETCTQACLDPNDTPNGTVVPPGAIPDPFTPPGLPPASATAIDPKRRLRMALQFDAMPANKIVDYELWSSAFTEWDTDFIADSKKIVTALSPRISFEPEVFVIKGENPLPNWRPSTCRGNVGAYLPCDDKCINGGRYCSAPRYNAAGTAVLVTGAAVVEENLRQLCLWSTLDSQPGGAGVGNAWWDYIVQFEQNCAKEGSGGVTVNCSRLQMQGVGIADDLIADAIDDCSRRNVRPPGPSTLQNPAPYVAADDIVQLDLEGALGEAVLKGITSAPMVVVDNRTLAGTVTETTCSHTSAIRTGQWRASCIVLDQICSAYDANDVPPACADDYCWVGPSGEACLTNAPTQAPTSAPTNAPTDAPTTSAPTASPTTPYPTYNPTASPTTAQLTKQPSSAAAQGGASGTKAGLPEAGVVAILVAVVVAALVVGGIVAAIAIYIVILKKGTAANNPGGLDGDMYVGLTDDNDSELL